MKSVIPFFQIGICTVGYLYATSNPAFAQVTSDGTVNTQVNQNGNTAEITAGETRGSNLFHSFQDFSVTTGNEAFFNNANDISNIFSRVTGGNISNINGSIRANGSANLFLINPAGIVFGEGARLDIGGSFYGSSASSILFEDGEFSAADLDNTPLLTVNAPIGLGFRDNPGDIINRSNLTEVVAQEERLSSEAFERLLLLSETFSDELNTEIEDRVFNRENSEIFEEVLLDLEIISPQDLETVDVTNTTGLKIEEGKNFALIGGNVFVESSPLSGEQITIGGLTQAGTVAFNSDGSFSFPEGIGRGNVSLSAPSNLPDPADINFGFGFVTGINTNNVSIYAKDLKMNNAVVFSDTLTIDALGSLVARNSVLSIPDIRIKALNATFAADANFTASIGGASGGGTENSNLSIAVSESLTFDNVQATAIAGNIDITTGDLNLNNGSIISTNILTEDLPRFESSDIGIISIDAAESIVISGTKPDFNSGSQISTESSTFSDTALQVEGVSSDNGLDISITTPNLVITDGGSILSSTSTAQNAGNISIDTNNLTLNGEGQIVSSTSGIGTSGNISINASELVDIRGVTSNDSVNGIFNQVEQDASGNGGIIDIVSRDLRLINGGQISAITRGSGNAGNLRINTVDIDAQGLDSGLFSRTGGTGDAGIVDITTSQLQARDNAQIGVDNFVPVEFEIESLGNGLTRVVPVFNPVEGSGGAGTLQIAADSIALESGGSLTAISAGGDGGNIDLNSNLLSFRDGGRISATAGLENTPGSGGNINIDSQFIIAFPQGNNDITANAFDGAGGNISIATEGIFGIQERPANPLTNDITASSETGISGNISIATPDINPVQGATELPNNVVETEQNTQQACRASRRSTANSGLNIAGKGGVVPDPRLPLNSLSVINSNEIAATIPAPIETSKGKIQPARGIRVSESGAITLTAYRTNNAGERLKPSFANCERI